MPFIVEGVSLLGIDSQECPMPARHAVWPQLAESVQSVIWAELVGETVSLGQVPALFERLQADKSRERSVILVGDEGS